MSLLLSLFISISALAIEAADNTVPIFQKANEQSRILVYTEEGEELLPQGRKGPFTKVKFRRKGKWRMGWVYSKDLQRERAMKSGNWGAGGGMLYSYLRQGSKSFATQDQVNYQTTEFTSAMYSPAFTIQFGREKFWRVSIAYRLTDYSTQASTDVVGADPRDVKVQHNMFSAIAQRGWPIGRFYYGAGAELAKAVGATVEIGGTDIPTTQEDLPTYFGIHAMFGTQLNLSSKLSLFIEGRPLTYFNQSPMVMGVEAAAALLYWP